MKSKVCRKCGKEKLLTDFFSEKRSSDGKRYSCKECDHARRIRYLTGLTLEQWEHRKALNKKHRKTDQEYAIRYRAKHPARQLIQHAWANAKRRSLPFDLKQHVAEIEARVAPMLCEMTGLPLKVNGTRDFNSLSIDRIVPKLGYVYSNIRIVCWAINAAMSYWGEATLKRVVKAWLSKESK
jgi:hypothetical protein